MRDKYSKQNILFIILSLSALLVLLVYMGWRFYWGPDTYRILLIHSYDDSYVWKDDFNKGVKDGFRHSRISADIQTFYLNAGHLYKEQEVELIDMLLQQYESDPPDLIITIDDKATNSLLRSSHQLATQVPIVFTGCDYIDAELLRGRNNVTGLTDKPDFRKCYQLARRLFGRISDIVIVAEDETATGREIIQEANRQLRDMPNLLMVYEAFPVGPKIDTLTTERAVVNPFSLHIEKIDHLQGSELRQTLFYQLHSFCILPKWSHLYSMLAHMGTAPILMINNEGFGDGRLGGYMVPGYNQTYEAALVAAEILNGVSPVHLPLRQSQQFPVFDWDQLEFWKIDPKVLPEDAIIPDMPLVVKYKEPLIAGLVIVSLFMILLVSLLARLYRRESYNKNKLRHHLEMEQVELDITMNSFNEGVLSIDANGHILSMNKAAVSCLNLDPSKSYTGYSVWSMFDIQERDNPDYLKKRVAKLSRSVAKSEKIKDTAFVVTPNRRVFPVSGNISSLDDGVRSFGVVITFRDITDEYTQKEFLALSMISGDIFTWQYNPTLDRIFFDKAFFEINELHDDGTHSMFACNFMESIHADDRQGFLKLVDELLAGEVQKNSISVRLQEFHGDDFVWWECRFSTRMNATTENTYKLFGICVNIDQFKQTEQELIRMRDEAERSDEMKGLFLANMSHEVRTPLNAIVGFSSILIENNELDQEDRKEFIDIINENCRLLLKLINEILDISRIESGTEFREEVCDVNQIVSEVVMMNQTARPKEVELRMHLPEVSVYMISDAFRLKQLLANLLENAYKFTKTGYVAIGYHAEEDDKHITFFVEDTGIGIEKDNISKIFDRFYKADDFIQGGGLGLPIVQEITQRLNGTIDVRTEPGKGSTFNVRIPWIKTITHSVIGMNLSKQHD